MTPSGVLLAVLAAAILALAAALAVTLLRLRRWRRAAALHAALLDSAAHDLRSPLSAVLGAVSALHALDASLDADQRRGLAATAADGARHLDAQIQSLLEARRLERGAHRANMARAAAGPADLRRAAAGARERLRDTLAGHKVESDIPDFCAMVRADPALTEQILVNLLDNAARHGPDRGRIALTARRRGGRVVLSVSDEGAGATAAPGLGLSIASAFARAMGGDVRPARGEGTRFELILRSADG